MMATEDARANSDDRSIEIPSRTERVLAIIYQIRGNTKAMVGLVILIPILLASLFGPYIAPYDPTIPHPSHVYERPSQKFLLGTDHLGRDLLSRVLIGGRTSLLLGFSSVALALLFGIPLGLTAGYMRGRVDEVIMRVMDIFMSIPSLLLGLLILTVLPSNVWNAIFAIGIVYTPRIARVVRSATLNVSTKEFVLAAKAQGESGWYILGGEILPNITAPIFVEASIRVGFAILLGASLSFLGLGAQPPHPDWGFMVSVARTHIWNTPWYLIWPSVALALTVFSVNMLGDGLRDVFDTKLESDKL